ncbi:hypothetical protein E1B28_002362 [Marasmius oreades]|uniref:DUF676 domain-containing protein n=1 Tax=Marasmius oreades TaxID=181124 RepID=A0A9P7RN71_9AGAR|nr:uncharacterized protein E1B28_002362 [Marasmius oreades]KAG7086407.1 hypothetical protein E1B28_002362 [Marasmius oreades]
MSQPIHLLVLVHGMWGNPSNLKQLELHASQKPEFHVMVAKANSEDSTYDGIDWGGERVAQEVLDEVHALSQEGKAVTRFSITGYSLGGLVSRYVIGILYQKRFFDDVTPVNFSSIATPHLGLPRYPSVMSYLGTIVGPRLLSRTGEQFYCVDKWSHTGRPLLEVMADPQRIFYQALAKFQEFRIFANAVYDLTVPYVTAAIEVDDPFVDHTTNGIQITLRDDYPRIIKSYTLPTSPPPKIKSKESKKSGKRPFMPPFLVFRFPLNILFYISLPFFVPVVITLLSVRLMKASNKSKIRIKLLEEGEKSAETLAKVLAKVEEAVEETVGNLIHGDSSPSPSPPSSFSTSASADEVSFSTTSTTSTTPSTLPPASKGKDVLSPLQKRIASQLNTLPIKKELAFFDDVYNAHGTIIMRDAKRFPFQKIGEGVVRKWGDSLRA